MKILTLILTLMHLFSIRFILLAARRTALITTSTVYFLLFLMFIYLHLAIHWSQKVRIPCIVQL